MSLREEKETGKDFTLSQIKISIRANGETVKSTEKEPIDLLILK